jgi:predicted nucleic acid-binding protein
MPAKCQVIYVDTNVIIEATRTNCWRAILNRYDVHTVAEVRKEALRVPSDKSDYVPIDGKLLDAHVSSSEVTTLEVAQASTKAAGLAVLDAGERDLLAHVANLPTGAWLVTTADRAAVKVACQLGCADRLVSLEEMADKCGQKPKLREWFTKKWLSNIRTAFLFES